MNQQQKDLMARALDMTEIELRAAMLNIISESFSEKINILTQEIVSNSIDTAYNPIRRTGVKF